MSKPAIIDPLSTLKVDQLRDMCRENGLRVSGTRDELLLQLRSLPKLKEAGLVITNEEAKAMEAEVDVALADADGFISINSDEEYQLAAMYLSQKVKPAMKAKKMDFIPIITPLEAVLKHARTIFNRDMGRFKEIEDRVKRAMSEWDEKKRREQEEKHRQLEEVLVHKAEESAADKAARLMEEGRFDEARELLGVIEAGEVKPAITMPVLVSKGARAENVSSIRRVRWEVVNEGEVKEEYWLPPQVDRVKIGGVVQELKEAAVGVVGGIKVWFESQINVRAVK